MKKLEDWAAVHNVYKQTKSKRNTATILGIARNTVKRLLALSEPPKYKRKIYSTKVETYKEQIIEWRYEPYDFNGTRIFRKLKKRGYTGSIAPIYRFLKKVDENNGDHISKKATVRHESPLGDQAQFDWTEYDVIVGGRYQKVYCFAIMLLVPDTNLSTYWLANNIRKKNRSPAGAINGSAGGLSRFYAQVTTGSKKCILHFITQK